MHRTSSRALRAAAWIALASAAAATPGIAAAADMYLKLGSIKGESAARVLNPVPRDARQIAVESFSWGATQAVYGHGTGGGMATGRVNKIDSFTVKQGSAAGPAPGGAFPGVDGLKSEVEVAESAPAPKPPNPSDVTLKRGTASVPPELPVMAGSVEPGASGMPAGKRQHGWVTVTKDAGAKTVVFPHPLERGSARVKVRFPWLDCAVGDRYPEASLEGAGMRYELKDVTITSCATEQISLNYAKVEVRGWDPVKK